MRTHDDLCHALLAPMHEAGRAIMAVRQRTIMVEQKDDGTPVTAADIAANKILINALQKFTPDIPIVSEEVANTFDDAALAKEFWLIDPLDGTREFIEGRDDFTVNIGLVRNGSPTFGMIYAPARNAFYMTRGPARAIFLELDVSTPTPSLETASTQYLDARRDTDAGPVMICASRSHRNPAIEKYLERFKGNELLEIGSSLKFCLVAAGRADVYPRFGNTHEWDTAAGHAIVLAAGGTVTKIDGSEFRYGKASENFLNPEFLASGKYVV